MAGKTAKQHVSVLFLNNKNRDPFVTDYPKKALVFLIIIGAAAASAVFHYLKNFTPPEGTAVMLLIWCTAGVLCESASVFLSKGNIYISTTDAVFFAALLTAGPEITAAVILCVFLFSVRFTERGIVQLFRIPPRLTFFNICHYIIILWITDSFLLLLKTWTGGAFLLPAVFSAPLFFILSCLLNALFYKYEEGRDFYRYFVDIFRPYLLDALLSSLGAIFIAFTYSDYGPISLLLFLTPFIVSRTAFRRMTED